MVKKVVGFIGTHILFFAGHLVGLVMNRMDGKFYGTYNWLMGASIKVQDWAGLDSPWKKMDESGK